MMLARAIHVAPVLVNWIPISVTFANVLTATEGIIVRIRGACRIRVAVATVTVVMVQGDSC